VAIVNETFAEQLTGGADPVGGRCRVEATPSTPEITYEIVGARARRDLPGPAEALETSFSDGAARRQQGRPKCERVGPSRTLLVLGRVYRLLERGRNTHGIHESALTGGRALPRRGYHSEKHVDDIADREPDLVALVQAIKSGVSARATR
jgi:hypothetical protein